MRFGLAATVAALAVALGSIASPAAATVPVPDDPLGCTAEVYDPSGVADAALAEAAHFVAESIGADVHVRIEQTVDGDIDARELQLESQCPTWRDSTGDRALDLLVVMVSPDERQTLIAFGETFYDELDTAGPQIQEFVMNPQFKLGNVQEGVIDGLQTISSVVDGGSVPGVQEPLYDSTDFTVAPNGSVDEFLDSSDDAPTGAIVFFVVILIIIVVASVVAKQMGWDTGTSSGTSGYRRSSYRSSSRSFSSSRSSGSSRRSSSSGSHRGGGSSSSSW